MIITPLIIHNFSFLDCGGGDTYLYDMGYWYSHWYTPQHTFELFWNVLRTLFVCGYIVDAHGSLQFFPTCINLYICACTRPIKIVVRSNKVWLKGVHKRKAGYLFLLLYCFYALCSSTFQECHMVVPFKDIMNSSIFRDFKTCIRSGVNLVVAPSIFFLESIVIVVIIVALKGEEKWQMKNIYSRIFKDFK